MAPIKAFLMEPTMTRRLFLRRYVMSTKNRCPKSSEWGCDTGFAPLGVPDEPFAWQVEDDGYQKYPEPPKIAPEDPRWPTHCEECGGALPPEAERQVHQEQVWRRADTGELIPRRSFPPGALWYEDGPHYGFASVFKAGGPDGKVLCAICPGGGAWCINSRASNCSRRDDETHRCWVRHGDPRAGTIHVDKNGNTCAAGAGSIISGKWHGFLHNGHFTGC